MMLVMALLTDAGEEVLAHIPMRYEEKIMPVDKWLELAYHLQKQRWDESIDWLEGQPVTKIQLMANIQKNFVESQNREMKRGKKK